LIFYAWGEPKYVLIMLFSVAINYRVAIGIGNKDYPVQKRRILLAVGIIVNLLLLFYFKYFVFSERIINKLFRMINYPQIQLPLSNIVLPIGISFYTFQSISYLIDVYKEPSLVQKNILDLGLYISFFPQLIAGPIVRYHDINEQIRNRTSSVESFSYGIERFTIGLSKKVLIANTMATIADMILDTVPYESVSALYLVLGIVSYTFQIYYDFSGYSDMASGLAKMFGFTILENFNYPYMSKSITEFWRRWHISLSGWFKDYLYIPLGGNRKGKARTVLNLFIVFFSTGLWHGAAINFVVWGLGHGVLLFIEKSLRGKIVIKNRIAGNIVGHVYVIVSIVLLWVFFRLGIGESFSFLKNIFTLNAGDNAANSFVKMSIDIQYKIGLFAAFVFSFPWWRKIAAIKGIMIVRYTGLIVLLVLSMCVLASNAYNPFIYFRF
jgi:alginate O-acetyltransferase complex protein AlgI